MIEVDRLVKHYRDSAGGVVRAVDGVSFRVDRGEMVGLLGANGAGKTTTLRILATLLRPTSGTARIDGRDVAALRRRERRREPLRRHRGREHDRRHR